MNANICGEYEGDDEDETYRWWGQKELNTLLGSSLPGCCYSPFALYDPLKGSWNHIAEIPAIALASIFLFGIDELLTQLEEPFTILPMRRASDKMIIGWRGQGLDDAVVKANVQDMAPSR